MVVGEEPAYNVDNDSTSLDMDWFEAKRSLERDREASNNPLWKHLRNIAIAAGCSPEDLYFTNIVKCATGDWDERAEHCVPYLAGEIASVEPNMMILHGGKVISEVFDMLDIDWSGSVTDVHGETFEFHNITILTFLHWGYAYRKNMVSEYNTAVARTISEAI